MKNRLSKSLALLLVCGILLSVLLCGCGSKKEKIIIYTSIEDYVVEDLSASLKEKFPDYDITIEYMSTGNHAAKLLAEGTGTECDIIYDLEYAYLAQLDEKKILADLSSYDKGIYYNDLIENENYIPHLRSGGAVIINTDLLKQKGLEEPKSYEDLLKPEFKGLISMPNPKSSGTGYMFLKSLVNNWGEEKAFDYFDKLTENILQYTSSGSGPVNALLQNEAVIGLGMTAQTVIKINEGAPFKIVYFEEGSPFTIYGQAMVSGKETRECVKEVFDYMVKEYGYRYNEKFGPEALFKDKAYKMENFPTDIKYSDMSNNSIAEKDRLLAMWKY
ncbi:MAG: extracellular solute-binding protein [Ruminococcaceae bacterium]|nr:extracellular solute-binding protein [Oscillospiraceae bacterium]